jgi:aromatic ring-opening dioxygenase LigB subunit
MNPTQASSNAREKFEAKLRKGETLIIISPHNLCSDKKYSSKR